MKLLTDTAPAALFSTPFPDMTSSDTSSFSQNALILALKVDMAENSQSFSGDFSAYTLSPSSGSSKMRDAVDTGVAAASSSNWKMSAASFYGSPLVITASSPRIRKVATNRAKVTFRWKTNKRATYRLYIDNKMVYTSSKARKATRTCTLKDGTHRYKIKATDVRGNSSSKSGTFVTDTKAPTRISGLSVKITAAGVTFRWKKPRDRSSLTYTLAYRKRGTARFTYIYGIKSLSRTVYLARGYTYEWTVRATDAYRNKGAYSTRKNFTNKLSDTTAPVIRSLSARTTKVSTGRSGVAFSWSSSEKATYILTLNGKQIYKGTSSSYQYSGALADGTHSYTLTATDAAGNSVSKVGSFSCDTTPPAKPVSAWLTNLRVDAYGVKYFTFNWSTVSDPSGVTYVVDFRFEGESSDSRMGEYATNYANGYSSESGVLYWWVQAVDGKGNASPWLMGEPLDLDAIDSTPPSITTLTARTVKTGSGCSNVTFNWAANETATYVLKLDGVTIYEGAANSYTAAVADGTHSYTLTATDKADNSTSRTGNFTCDTTPPALSNLTVTTRKALGHGYYFTFSWTSSESATYVVRLNGGIIYQGKDTTCGYSSSLDDANYHWTWDVQASDQNGNTTAQIRGENFITEAASSRAAAPAAAATGSAASGNESNMASACLPLATIDRELEVSAGSLSSTIGMPQECASCSSQLKAQEQLINTRNAALAAAL